MALDAIALLQLRPEELPEGVLVRALSDGVLVRTRASFAAEPDELARALRRVVGDALDRHRDARGVLILPEVAAPRGETYAAVVDEVGEGGAWIGIDEEDEAELDGEGDLLTTMMRAMSSPDMQSAIARARAAMAGDPAEAESRMIELARSMSGGADAASAAQVRSLMGQASATEATQPPVDLGALMGDPAFQRMVDDVRTQLLADPEKLAQLQSLFGAIEDVEDDEEEDDDSGSGELPS